MAPAWIDFQYSCVVPMGMTAMDNLPSPGSVDGPQAVNNARDRRAAVAEARQMGLLVILRPIVTDWGLGEERP